MIDRFCSLNDFLFYERETNVQIHSTEDPLILHCSHCGTIREEILETCSNCSAELPVRIL